MTNKGKELTKHLLPFDFEEAKAGAKLVTRFGDKARIICYDRVNYLIPIVALVTDSMLYGTERICCYDIDGKIANGHNSKDDLFIFKEESDE